MRFAVYAQYVKARHFTEAIVQGFPGRVRNIEPGRLASGCVHVFGGLQFGCLELFRQIRRLGEPYVFFDRAYFGGGTFTDRLRLTRGAYQRHWVEDGDAARLAKWGVELEPWREGGEFVVVVPPSPEVEALFGLKGWEAETLKRLDACTDRPVMVSRKSDRDASPLRDRLANCHAVVTWTSNVAVEAVCMGIPAFVSPWSAARPAASALERLEAELEQPARPDRAAWAVSLAGGQFTVDEIAGGVAREVLLTQGVPA